MIDDAAREREALRRWGERGQLQLQAFDEIARADTDRVELLHQQQDALDLFLVMKHRADRSMVGKVEGDLGEGLRQVAVVIDRIDQRCGDFKVGFGQTEQGQLTEQVFAQRLPSLVGEVAGAVLVILGSTGVAAGTGAVGPRLVYDLDFDRFGEACLLGGRRGGREVCAELEVHGLCGFGLLLLQHDVGFEHFGKVRLQFERRHLQEADGLLQLRRHRERLAELELQRLLEHREDSRGVPGTSLTGGRIHLSTPHARGDWQGFPRPHLGR